MSRSKILQLEESVLLFVAPLISFNQANLVGEHCCWWVAICLALYNINKSASDGIAYRNRFLPCEGIMLIKGIISVVVQGIALILWLAWGLRIISHEWYDNKAPASNAANKQG